MPYFDYAEIVYEKAPGVDLEKIQRLQKRALKVCLKVGKFEETEVIHRRAKIRLLSKEKERTSPKLDVQTKGTRFEFKCK